jgi:hypothetical protein
MKMVSPSVAYIMKQSVGAKRLLTKSQSILVEKMAAGEIDRWELKEDESRSF